MIEDVFSKVIVSKKNKKNVVLEEPEKSISWSEKTQRVSLQDLVPDAKKFVFDEHQKLARDYLIKEVLKSVQSLKKVRAIERIKSGIHFLDGLIQGGFEKGSTILTVGSAGTGKTTFGLQFLYYGARDFNEPGIYISFEEDRESILRHASVFDWNLSEVEQKGLLRILYYKPHQVEKLIKEGGGPIRDAVKALNAKRLVIDSITAYSMLFKDEYQKRESVLDLFSYLKKWGCTSLIVSELSPKMAEIKEGNIGFMTDSIIALYYSKQETGERVHCMEILKMRGTKHTDKLLVIQFEKNGIKVYPDLAVF